MEKAYLKSTLEHLGTAVADVRAAMRPVVRRPDLDHDGLVDLALGLWEPPIHERRLAAVELLRGRADLLTGGDLPLLEELVREARTWALVDVLAASVVGPIVEHDPAAAGVLDRWVTDEDVWVRRAALLALLVPLRAGRGDWERFARYADAMLDEREFFIRKASGWVLRDTGRRRPDLVHAWLLPRSARASGVTWREAVKPLTDEQRAELERARSAGG
ncbi:DNA alkylation repair protein [Actinomarinicola tropica]|uniref:DNA alkylation repair protein n=2 Tax=Actinomarinicola tropica TaxID=2789776 RepID=A0A5Q2RPT0_9ACTN|nr:DNA alkylation repair protein [Actinomarinicola tropica]